LTGGSNIAISAPPPLSYQLIYSLSPHPRRPELKITFNGFPEEFEDRDLTVQDLLDRTKEDDPAVIVEVNGRFVYRKDFSLIRLRDGDRVEFIHPSFGG